MKKQYIGILFSISLVAQPAMAAHISVLSWSGAENEDTNWNERIFQPHQKGKRDIPKLSQAVLLGDGDKIRHILKNEKKEHDVNEADVYGATPMHFAALKGHNDILDILMENGGDINAQDRYGRTPLMYAIVQGHQKTVDRILKKYVAAPQKAEYTPLNLNIVDNLGRTALHWAVSKAKFNITDALIDAGADVRKQDNEGNTALHYAASIRYMFGKDKVIDTSTINRGFIDAAAVAVAALSVSAAMVATGGIPFALTTAALGPLFATVLLVVAVIVALVYGSIAIDKALDKYNDEQRRNEIHGHRNKIIKRLLEKDKTLVSMVNKDGRIPSHFAALAGNQAPQELLNAASKSPATELWAIADNSGFTPLMCAIMGGHSDNDLKKIGLSGSFAGRGFSGVDTKRALGMQVTSKDVKFISKNNVTPLKFSLMFQDSKKFGDILNVVNDQDIYADAEGRTILHYAAMAGNHISKIYAIYGNTKKNPWYKIDREKVVFKDGKFDLSNVEYIFTQESLVTAPDIYGATPIHYAAMTTIDGLKFLLNKVDNLDIAQMTDKNGMTPLHYAAMSGKEEAVELLLNKVVKDQREEFANIKTATVDTYGNQLSADIAGKTARDLAQQAGHVNLVAYLSKKMGEKKSDDKKAWADRQQETREIQKEKARAGKTELIQEKKDKILERKTENIEKKAEQKRWDEDKKTEKLENKTKMKKINKNLEAHLQ